MNILSGWKTYIAGIGLVGLAVYQASISHFSEAFNSLMLALAAFGLRSAIANK